MTTGRHTATELDPSLDDYQLASALVREAGQLALLMRMGGLQGERKTSVSDVVTAADGSAAIEAHTGLTPALFEAMVLMAEHIVSRMPSGSLAI